MTAPRSSIVHVDIVAPSPGDERRRLPAVSESVVRIRDEAAAARILGAGSAMHTEAVRSLRAAWGSVYLSYPELRAARDRFALVAKGAPEDWRPIAQLTETPQRKGRVLTTAEQWFVIWPRDPEVPRDEWVDFACPVTGAYGQAYLRADGTWRQAPRGERPVLLEWLGGRR